MCKSQLTALVLILLILVVTDLSEAKGGRGGGGGGRGSRGGGYRYRGGSGSSYYGGGDFDLEIFLIIIGVIAGLVILVCICVCICDSDDEDDKVTGQMIQENNQQRNISSTRYQYQQNHQNSDDGSKLSPNHFSYPISPANVPQSGQNPTNYPSETVSQPLYAYHVSETGPQPLPRAYLKSENQNLKTNNDIHNETHLPYSLTPAAVPPPYSNNQSGWNLNLYNCTICQSETCKC